MNDDLDENEALAAEYVLGSLDAGDRRAAEERLAQDRAFAQLVDAWTRRLAPLATTAMPVEPRGDVWKRIEAAIAEDQQGRASAQVLPLPAKPARSRFDRLWRGWAIASTAVAAALALYVATRPPAEPAIQSVALLAAADARIGWVVAVNEGETRVRVRPEGTVEPIDGSWELWLIEGQAAPRSLGLITRERDIALNLPATMARPPAPGIVLAVSQEPVGGSPTGLPTGPVRFTGTLVSVSN
jgi:anti-sigma-K factor RskA